MLSFPICLVLSGFLSHILRSIALYLMLYPNISICLSLDSTSFGGRINCARYFFYCYVYMVCVSGYPIFKISGKSTVYISLQEYYIMKETLHCRCTSICMCVFLCACLHMH